MSDNFDRYTELFLDEASEQIEDLNQNLLRLEREGFDPEIINEIFRTAHTLKSSTAFVGLDDLSELSHVMEDVLQKVKDNAVAISTELVNLLFLCLDRIKQAVAVVAEGQKPTDTYEELIQELQAVGSSPADASSQQPASSDVEKPDQASEEYVSEEDFSSIEGQMPADEKPIELSVEEDKALLKAAGKHKIYSGIIRIDAESPMPNMRFFLLLQNLKKMGTVFLSRPSEDALEQGGPPSEILKFIFYGNVTQGDLSQICQIDMVEEVHLTQYQANDYSQADDTADSKGSLAVPPGTDEKESKEEDSTTQVSTEGLAARRKAEPQLKVEETHLKTRNIKVASEKIDYLLNSVGELVITNSGLQKIYEDLYQEYGDSFLIGELKSKIDQAARIARDLQSGIMKTRMIPVGLVFHRFTRPVRDLALELGKDVNLVFHGEDTELDKNIIDALNDPLLHLLRNSLDHGIESPEERKEKGKPAESELLLNAYQSGNNIFVEIRDDGRGLNRNAIVKKAVKQGLVASEENLSDDEVFNLIFQPGFSTSEQVTDVSGRGVGMSVVKKMVQEFKGSVQVQNRPGEGSSFILSFPLTLAIISAILVRVEGEEYAFPLSDVVETIRIAKEDITTLQGKDIINLRGDILPVFYLSGLMGLPVDQNADEFPVVIANIAGRKIGFVVDQMVGKQEIVIKSLEQNYRSIRGLIGACLMGDGSIVMVLDVHGLLELAQQQTITEASNEEKSESLIATINYNESVLAMAGSASLMGRRASQKKQEVEHSGIEKQKAKTAALTGTAATNGKTSDTANPSMSWSEFEASPDRPASEDQGVSADEFSDSSSTAEYQPEKTEPESPVPDLNEETSRRIQELEKDDQSYSSFTTDSGYSTDSGDESSAAAQSGDSDAENRATNGEDDYDSRLSGVLEDFQKDKQNRIRIGRSGTIGEESLYDRELSEDDYSKLYAVINTGMINAGLVLSQLLGVTVEVSVPEFKAVNLSDLTEYIPPDDIIGVTIHTEGEFSAFLLLIFDEATGYKAAGDLMGLPIENWNKESMDKDDVKSVLSELTNIVGSSILNELANKTGLSITPSVPGYFHGAADNILNLIKEETTVDKEAQAIYISTDFFREETELLGRLFLLPSRPNLIQLVDKL